VVHSGAYGFAVDIPLADMRATTDCDRTRITDGVVGYRQRAHREEDASPSPSKTPSFMESIPRRNILRATNLAGRVNVISLSSEYTMISADTGQGPATLLGAAD
jgi:hypothetical protein